jgi:hypothetical protein
MDDMIEKLENSMDNQKYRADLGDLLRPILQLSIANSNLLREVITRQIEIEQKQTLGTSDPDTAWAESGRIHDESLDKADECVMALLAKFTLDKDSERG